jgi:hypothetical protein
MSVGRAVPLPEVVLFAALGWLPAVALAVAVVVSLGSVPRSATPAPAPPAAGADLFAALGTSAREGSAGTRETAPPGAGRVTGAGTGTPRKARTLLARSGTGNWTGPRTVSVPDAPMTVTYRAVCRSGPSYLTLSWDGAGPDYDYLTVTGALRMSGTGRLDPASAAGRVEVRTRADCAWTVRITQTS